MKLFYKLLARISLSLAVVLISLAFISYIPLLFFIVSSAVCMGIVAVPAALMFQLSKTLESKSLNQVRDPEQEK